MFVFEQIFVGKNVFGTQWWILFLENDSERQIDGVSMSFVSTYKYIEFVSSVLHLNLFIKLKLAVFKQCNKITDKIGAGKWKTESRRGRWPFKRERGRREAKLQSVII